MKYLLSMLLVLSSLAAPSLAMASTNVAAICGPDAPIEWTRDGGYCAQIAAPNSLAPTKGGDPVEDAPSYNIGMLAIGERLDVAVIDPCNPPCSTIIGMSSATDFLTDRIRLAAC